MKLLSHFLLFAAVCSSPLQAVTVTTLIDEDDGDLIAESGAANGISLREAINHTTPGDTVTFDPTLSGSTITLSNGQLLIDQDLTIDASALADGITIDANGPVTNHRVLEITPGNTVNLDTLTLTNGVASGDYPADYGGAIYNDQATLNLSACTLFGNSADQGGGIFSNGANGGNATLSLTACTIYGNSATRRGGGIFAVGIEGNATLNLASCTVYANSVEGIYRSPSSTFPFPTPSGYGGGIACLGRLLGPSGNVTLSLENTILAGNTAPTSPDVMLSANGTSLTLLGKNLMSDSNGLVDDTLIVAPDPMLSPLSDYGGPTLTITPLPGSPAIDMATVDPLITTDQRGLPRSFDGDEIAGALPDIGAVESHPFVVTNNNDSGSGSLREAIEQPFAYITFDSALSGETITLSSDQLLIDQDLTIDASTLEDGVTIDANGSVTNHRVLEITPENTVNLNTLTLTNGVASGDYPANSGGAIFNDNATLSLTACTLFGNFADEGGGIYSNGANGGNATLSLTACTLSENSASSGGGIHSSGTNGGSASLDLRYCTLSGNAANNSGGGIESRGEREGNTALSLTSCTLSENSAGELGGAISSHGPDLSGSKTSLSLISCTISGNSSSNNGGGIYSHTDSELGSATLSLKNTILAGNTAPNNPDLSDTSTMALTLLGKNLMSDSNGLIDDALIVAPDPMLRPLGDYGGSTQTMLPLPGSQAIDMATADSLITSDQRGVPRPFDGDEIEGALPDIGAVEFHPNIVNNNNDSGAGSLRNAIEKVVSGDTITFDSALSGSTITLSSGQFLIDQDLTIDASALADGITIDANGSVTNHRVLEITPQHTVNLHSLTLTNGVASAAHGGAIYSVRSTLSLTACTLSNNSTVGDGGAIYSDGDNGGTTLSLSACTLSNNSSARYGGGILSSSSYGHATLSLTSCTLSGNSAIKGGGGIYSLCGEGSATLSLTSCTISGNFVEGYGYEFTSGGGGGIKNNDYLGSATLSLKNTILAGNTAPAYPDLAGTVTSLLGMNLMSDSNDLVDDALIVAPDPMLSPLGDYGGPTQTMPPLPGSPAIEGALLLEGSPLTDQRGAPRPSGPLPDIGAVEAFPFSTLALDDTDSDKIPDLLEGPDGPYPHLVVGIDDSTLDTDGDGSLDKDEIGNMTNPLDANDYFRILSIAPASDFDAQSNPVLEITVKTFPGLEYEFECNQDLDFSGTPDTIDLGTADQFTETLEVQLAPGKDFIRAVRK